MTKALETKECEDCGWEVKTHRTRCPHCRMLVCRWCRHHSHTDPFRNLECRHREWEIAQRAGRNTEVTE